MKPLFITFEGLDGSGKSTHLQWAGEWLRDRGLPVHVTKEPGGTPLGDAIRGVFLDPQWGKVEGRVEALMVFASRRQHLVELIEPALAAGEHVLCDRFTDSSIAYQGSGRGLPAGWVEALDQLVTDGRRPDLTLLFDLPAEMATFTTASPLAKAIFTALVPAMSPRSRVAIWKVAASSLGPLTFRPVVIRS